MKFKLLLSAVFLFTLTHLFAQEDIKKQKRSPEESAVETLGKLEEKIELDDQQRKSVYDIHVDFFTSMHEVMKEKDREKMQELEEARNEKVKEVLEKKQYRKYLTVMEENKPQRPQGGRGGQGGMRGRGGRMGGM
ncbi:hypothetical protein [Flammeovirga sp. SJP92]|uniref:hypothetical protein n=1 Tax=Flammeovirga sp. SJP92 TaxID=1775430 RepID=UPI00078869D5|nr:hypothetical protein [Flammeovirga sp. SJP92]KXX70229.1 hypothetical protein AVL50_15305 [Flammeovirga sp. SJP92]